MSHNLEARTEKPDCDCGHAALAHIAGKCYAKSCHCEHLVIASSIFSQHCFYIAETEAALRQVN